jgi:hypothetical protein
LYAYTIRSGIVNESTHYNVTLIGYPTANFTNNSDLTGTLPGSSVFVNVSGSSSGNISTVIDFDNSLVGWWTLGESSWTTAEGEVKDYMGRNNGTSVGGANTTSSGYFGRGGSFDGDNDYIQVSQSDSLNNLSYITLSGWIKPLSGYGVFAYKYGSSKGFVLYAGVSGVKQRLFLDGSSVDSNNFLTANQWNHIVVVYNGTNAIFYLNGVNDGSPVLSKGEVDSNNEPLYIGINPSLTEDFNGTIDDVMIFNRSLSAEEIAGLYANTSSKYTAINYTGLADGTHNVTGYVQSLAGRITSTGSRSITLDSVIPNVQFVSPTPDDGNVTFEHDIFVNVSASDNAGNVSSFVNFNGSVVSWWRMDELSGTTVIDYMNRTNGTSVNTNQTGLGHFGKAMDFSTTSSEINTGSNTYCSLDGSKNFTFSGWAKDIGVSASSVHTIYGEGRTSSTTPSCYMGFVSNTTGVFPLIGARNDAGTVYNSISGTNLNRDQWYHVVMVGNGTNKTLYVNGNSVTSVITSGAITLNRGTVGGLRYTSLINIMNGSIDDVMVINRSLSPEEVMALYGNASSSYTSNYTVFSGGAHNVTAYAQDIAGNVNSTSRTISRIFPPSITISYPTNNSTVNYQTGSTLNYTVVSGGSPSDTCWYNINGTANVTISGCTNTSISVSQGWNNLTIYANDSYNQVASNFTTFFVDSIVPTLFVDEPFDVVYSNGTDVTINVSTTEGSTGSLVSNLDNGLVSWWRMDDANSTKLFDYMGRYNGTLAGQASQTSSGKLGKGFTFDGSGDYVNFGDVLDMGTRDFSISYWVLYNGARAERVISKRTGCGANTFLELYHATDGDVFFYTYSDVNGDCAISTTKTYALGVWHHVVAVRNSTDLLVYIDGSMNATGSCSPAKNLDNSYNFLIGDSSCSSDELTGKIDEVRVWNRSLTSSEILGLYNATSINYNVTLAEGNHTYQAFAQDSNGNVNVSTLFGFEVDSALPFVGFNLTTPYDGSQQPETYFTVGMNVSDTYGAYSFVDLDNSLVGYWRGEDGANDTIGVNNGTFAGNATTTRNGKFGKAFTFDGSGDYVDVGQTPSLNVSYITLSAWVKYNSVVPFGTIIGRDDSTNRDWAFYQLNANTLRFFVFTSGTAKIKDVTFSPVVGQWYYLSGTYNGSDVIVYINGTDQGSHTLTSGVIDKDPVNIQIGDDLSHSEFNGSIDEVMIFNRSLSDNEIAQLYNTSRGNYANQFSGLSEPVNHTIKGYAVDMAGNINTTETRSIYVDSTVTNVCRTLDEANAVYNLTGNITASSASCIVVGADNVTLDMKGYYIIGGASNVNGVVNSIYNNFTLKNGHILGFNYSVYSIGESYLTNISNMTFSNASLSGVYATLYNSTITNITIRNIPYGIVLGGNYSNLTDFLITNSSYGVDYAGAYFSGFVNGVVENGTINNSGYGRGVYVYDSSVRSVGSVFRNINISDAVFGVSVTGAGLYMEGISFENISISGSSKTDYYLINSSLAGYDFDGNSLVLENEFGALNYTNTTIYASGTNMSGIFNITNNNVFVNASKDESFNTTANITIKGLNGLIVVSPEARVDLSDSGIFEDCPTSLCNNLSYSDGVFIYNVTHFTSYSSEEFNTAPDTPPFVSLNSSSGENISSDNLTCNTHTSDPDGGTLTVLVNWYMNGAYNQTANYTVANATNYSAILTSGNTTKYENWSCGVMFYDAQDSTIQVNSSNLTLVNDIPDITIGSPDDWSAISNRTPEFNWTVTEGDGEDTITYEFNLTESKWSEYSSAICVGEDVAETGMSNNYYLQSSALDCLYDNGYNYNWSVRAYDGEAYGEWVTAHVNITADTTITLTNDEINFGALYSTNVTDTTSDHYPLLIRNDGNAMLNVSVNSSALWTTQPTGSSYYQFKIDNVSGESGSFNWTGSITSWLAIPITGDVVAIDQLNYSDSKDSAEVDIRLEVPPNEPSGAKMATVVFTSRLDE